MSAASPFRGIEATMATGRGEGIVTFHVSDYFDYERETTGLLLNEVLFSVMK